MSTDHENSTSLKYNLLGSFSMDVHPDDWDIDGWDIDDYKEKIAKLSDYDLYDCAFQAALRGNVRLLRLLYSEKGQIEVRYENKAPNLTRHVLNGVTYAMSGIPRLTDVTSVADFKDLLKAIQEFGIQGLSEPGDTAPALFHQIDSNKTIAGLKVERFSGDLPQLSGGLLTSPELAIALKHEEATNPHSRAYRSILCWASPDMVESFPESLAPLTHYQEIGTLTKGRRPMADFKAGAGEPDNMMFDTIVTGLNPSSRAVSAQYLMKSLCPLSSYYGFEDLQGRVLCETNTDFLLAFEAQGVTADNTQLAKSFARNYCPIELIATQARDTCLRDFGYREKQLWFMDTVCSRDHYAHQAFNDFFSLLANDHPLQARAKELMEVEQWKGLLSKADSAKLTAASLIAMNQAFGVDNTGLRLTVTSGDVDTYLDAGFRFSGETHFFDTDKAYKAHLNENFVTTTTAVLSRFNWSSLGGRESASFPNESILDKATRDFQDVVLKLNIWPSDSERPLDLADALRMAGPIELNSWGNNRAMGIRAILADAGLEACAKLAKTPRAWLKLTDVFPRDEIEPYIKQMPREAKGKLLEQDLGM